MQNGIDENFDVVSRRGINRWGGVWDPSPGLVFGLGPLCVCREGHGAAGGGGAAAPGRERGRGGGCGGRLPLRLMKHKVSVLLPYPWAWPAGPWVGGGRRRGPR
jgi:hypothetical protein